MLVRTHGRIIMGAVLNGFAGAAPRSATPNLIELLSTLTQRFPAESRQWMTEVLFAVGVVPLAFLWFTQTIFTGRFRTMQGQYYGQGAIHQGSLRVCNLPVESDPAY